MPSLDSERIGIVGLGAIGGSLALALKGRAPLVAWSRHQGDRDAARAAGINVCRGDTWATELAGSTAVVIAVPLDEVALVIRELLPHLRDACLVMHVSSLQRREALGLAEAEFERVVGTHPIAGSERSGFGAAHAAMFRHAAVRAEARARDSAGDRIETLWRAAGASRFLWGDSTTHDALMAWVSHLPQLTATALAALLAERGVGAHDLGAGARDTTRLAGSDLAMWAPLLEKAPPETVDALRHLTSTLGQLSDALERHDQRSLTRTWERARSWRARSEEPT